MAAVAYVAGFELRNADGQALVRVLLILTASLAVSVFCAIAQPIHIIDESVMTMAGRANLCLAIVDTVIVVILVRNPSSAELVCQLGGACRAYPVGWVALAGMHYCYATWAYGTMLIDSR